MGELGGLAEQRESLAAEVPVELLKYIDEGGNPDVFTAEAFRRAHRGNQLAKGRVQAFAQLRRAPARRVRLGLRSALPMRPFPGLSGSMGISCASRLACISRQSMCLRKGRECMVATRRMTPLSCMC